MSDISRRTLAKGAAWTAPAISVAAAAPSLAASSEISECPAGPGWRDIGASLPTWNLTRAAGGGSRVQLNVGDITPSLNAPSGTTGFRWKPDTVTAIDNAGGSHTGRVVTDTDTAYVIGAGGAMSAGVVFDSFDYNGPGTDTNWHEDHRLESYTFTYRIQWLRGLTTILECSFTSTITATFRGPHLGGRLSDFR